MKSTHLAEVFVLLMFQSVSLANNTFWVSSTDQDCVNGPSCDTLDGYYQRNSSIFSTSNSTWIFLKGSHNITFTLQIIGAESVTFEGESESYCKLLFMYGASVEIKESRDIIFQYMTLKLSEPGMKLCKVINVALYRMNLTRGTIEIVYPSGLYSFEVSSFQNVDVEFTAESHKTSNQLFIRICNVTLTRGWVYFRIMSSNSSLSLEEYKSEILITNSTFKSTGFIFQGRRMYDYEFNSSNNPLRSLKPILIVEKCKFYNEISDYEYHSNTCRQFTVLNSTDMVSINNCIFKNNYMFLFMNSYILFSGHNLIVNNSIRNGNPLNIFYSILLLENNSYLEIRNNSGDYSGGIYGCLPPDKLKLDATFEYLSECERKYVGNQHSRCFFQPVDQYGQWLMRSDLSTFNGSIFLKNNTNHIYEGNNIYAGHISNCTIQTQDGNITTNETYLQNFIKLPSWNPYDIASPPYRLCLCGKNGDLMPKDCNGQTNMSLYPGEELILHISLLGDYSNKNVLYRIIVEIEGNMDLTMLTIQRKCQEYNVNNYKVINSTIDITLKTESDPFIFLSNHNVSHNVHVEVNFHCPPGFVKESSYLQSNEKCSCNSLLNGKGFVCSIDQGLPKYQQMHKYRWIGVRSLFLVISNYCPSFYCDVSELQSNGVTLQDISAEHTTKQCNTVNRRRGFFCSECTKGYSTTFGGFKCIECSNVWLLLIFIYALAGPLLLTLLFAFNLTIVHGAINGILLYVNIVYLYDDYLQEHANGILYIVFSLLNFGTGRNVCFYDGMDEFSKTLLQYAFPIYLIILAALIIIGAQVFKLKLFRVQFISKRCVPVLATIMVLTFTSFVDVCWISLRAAVTYSVSLQVDDTERVQSHSPELLWFYQPSLGYFRGKHLILGMVAISVCILYILPLTVVVLFGDFLRRRCIHRTWFSHVIDVFQGAYRKPYGFWLGVRLLLRICFVIAHTLHYNLAQFAYTTLHVILLFLCLENLIKPFCRKMIIKGISSHKEVEAKVGEKLKNRIFSFIRWLTYPQVIDNVSLLNIIFMSAVIIGNPYEYYLEDFVCNLSIAIAIIQLSFIFGFHGYIFFPIPRGLKFKWRKLKKYFLKRQSQEGNIEEDSVEFFPFRDVQYISDPPSSQQQ